MCLAAGTDAGGNLFVLLPALDAERNRRTKRLNTHKCDKNNAYKLDPSDYECEDDYLDALRSCWQAKYDPDHIFNGFCFNRFMIIDDYLLKLHVRLNWIKECDPEELYSKIDSSKYENMFQFQHFLDLRKALKKV